MTFDFKKYTEEVNALQYVDVASQKFLENPDTQNTRDMASVALVGKPTQSAYDWSASKISNLLNGKQSMLLGPLVKTTTDNLDDILCGTIAPSWGDNVEAGLNFLMNMPAVETDKYESVNKAHLSYAQAETNLRSQNIGALVGDIANDYMVQVQGVLSTEEIARLYQETVIPAKQFLFAQEIATGKNKDTLNVDVAKHYAWNLYENCLTTDDDGNYVNPQNVSGAVKTVAYGALQSAK
jgi:hypothetical protein